MTQKRDGREGETDRVSGQPVIRGRSCEVR